MPCFQVRTPQERSAAVGSGAKSLTAATLQDAAGSDPISQQQKQNLQHRPGSATSVSHTDRKVQKRPLHNVNQKSQDEVNTKQKVFCQKFYQNIFTRLMCFQPYFPVFTTFLPIEHKKVWILYQHSDAYFIIFCPPHVSIVHDQKWMKLYNFINWSINILNFLSCVVR